MRCYFHLVSAHGAILDEKGLEVAHLDELRAQVLKVTEELRQEDFLAARDWNGCTLQVSDASGGVLVTLSLDGLSN